MKKNLILYILGHLVYFVIAFTEFLMRDCVEKSAQKSFSPVLMVFYDLMLTIICTALVIAMVHLQKGMPHKQGVLLNIVFVAVCSVAVVGLAYMGSLSYVLIALCMQNLCGLVYFMIKKGHKKNKNNK